MKDINLALYSIRRMEEIGEKATVVHNINSIVKIIITVAYIIKVVSLKRFNLGDIAICITYPLVLFILGNIPIIFIIKKTLVVIPVVIGIVIVNLIIEPSYNEIFFSLLLILKCVLSVTGGILLIATTGMNEIASGLRRMKIPNLFVTQIMLIYRYITLMLEEGHKIVCAYILRSRGDKGIKINDFQGILGAMLLRSIDRGENVYEAMKLRGFNGEYYTSKENAFNSKDLIYLTTILILFIFV